MALIDQYLQGYTLLVESIRGLSEDQMKKRVEEGKWTIQENVIHLVDADLVYSERIKRIIAEEEAILLPFDQDRWTERLYYHQGDLEQQVQLFQLIRNTTANLLRAISEKDWEKTGMKDGEPVSITQLVQALVEHVEAHVGTIKKLRQKV